PFAGHPTLGSCHAWLHFGGVPKGDDVVQECGVGLVHIRRQGQRLSFAAPPLRRAGPLSEDEVGRIAHGLGLNREDILHHAWCDNGPKWRAVMLRSAQQVLALQPDAAVLAGLYTGVVGPYGSTTAAATAVDAPLLEVRAFFPNGSGMGEDPVTGSLNAALAQWLIEDGVAPARYIASQGTALGREGRVHLACVDGEVWVGGECVTCIDGEVML
ncbi:MAG: PhzF family phenazine biosynthesis protein, partial [Betaproteobacteria bacterium]|nr:PhzF family phenazine biosynthesis protein [Betaproteobacteria bacterium]